MYGDGACELLPRLWTREQLVMELEEAEGGEPVLADDAAVGKLHVASAVRVSGGEGEGGEGGGG